MINQIPTTPKKKKKSKRRKNHYFTQVHEDAIVRYAKITCKRERTELYVILIGPAFNEMVDKIVFTYKFTNLPNIDYLRDECKIWFIHKVKKQQKRNKREVDYDNIAKKYEEQYLSTDESYLTEREELEFWNSFYKELKSWDSSQMKENDLRVYKAINILFESKEDIEIFNKKAIYLYLREITGLNTKQIVNSLKKFRRKYSSFKESWDDGQL